MMKKIITLIMVLAILPLVEGTVALSSQGAFCEHQGYKLEILNIVPYCIFDDGTNCTMQDFYDEECGVDKVREIPLRKDGESIYFELGEKCEEGLWIKEPQYVLDSYHCYKPNLFQIIWRKIKSLVQILDRKA